MRIEQGNKMVFALSKSAPLAREQRVSKSAGLRAPLGLLARQVDCFSVWLTQSPVRQA